MGLLEPARELRELIRFLERRIDQNEPTALRRRQQRLECVVAVHGANLHSRIARELHDRIAQSLAYIAFELERLEAVPGDKRSELADLREVVRGVVQELRETIYQLRTSITEDGDLAGLVAEYLERFAERTGVITTLSSDVTARLAPRTEQEFWRIIQEARSEEHTSELQSH